jgi:protein gp37
VRFRQFPGPIRHSISAWHGVSCEPLLGPIDIADAKPDWLITGGESGPRSRPLDMDAMRSVRDQSARMALRFTTNGMVASTAKRMAV